MSARCCWRDRITSTKGVAIGQCWKTVEMDIHVSNVAARYLPGHGVVGSTLMAACEVLRGRVASGFSLDAKRAHHPACLACSQRHKAMKITPLANSTSSATVTLSETTLQVITFFGTFTRKINGPNSDPTSHLDGCVLDLRCA